MPYDPENEHPETIAPGVKLTRFADGGIRIRVEPVDGVLPHVKPDLSKRYRDHVIVDRPRRR